MVVDLLGKYLQMRLTLHVPIEDAFGALAQAVLEPRRELIQPFASIFLVKAKNQAIPVCNFDSLISILYTILLFL